MELLSIAQRLVSKSIKSKAVIFIACLLSLSIFACTNTDVSKETEKEVTKKETTLKPLNFTILVHLEGWKLDRINPQGKLNHEAYMDEVIAMVDLLNSYNATFTWESSYLQFLRFGRLNNPEGVFDPAHPKFISTPLYTFLKNNKQDIGVHGDLGGNSTLPYTQGFFTNDMSRMKTNIDLRGGISNHVSGICSHLDWVSAAVKAGYKFTTSNVAYCVSAMAEADRPEVYKDCVKAADCHQTYPNDIASRIHPWRMKNAATWLTDDASGSLVMLPSSGLIDCKAEAASSEDSLTGCTFDDADILALTTDLDAALANRDATKINMYYGVFSVGSIKNKVMLEKLLKAIQVYVDDGDIVWSSANEIYDAYVDWEKDNR